jgi:putative restriction endonuclease
VDGADASLRAAAFLWLSQVTDFGERSVSWGKLTRQFRVDGEPVVLIGSKGIWKPAQMELPISITTSPPRDGRDVPYDDEVTDDGLLRYRYEGTDPQINSNRWLRECWRGQVPLVYFHGVARGVYIASWPVLVVEDRPEELSVMVEMLDPQRIRPDLSIEAADEAERRFYYRLTRQRLDQAAFRVKVLSAYQTSCAMCRLRHGELLDAAHIVPHSNAGPSTVPNGLALCKIHHAAYDHDIVGVRPDHVIQLRTDMLDEVDGPMLRHGLQEIHNKHLYLPRRSVDRPAPEFLEQRWEQFATR